MPSRLTRPRALAAIALSTVVVAAAAVTAVVLTRGDGPSHPDEWDPRVLEYVEFVESERDLEFEQPVHVDFLPVKEFEKEMTSDEADLTDEDREELEQAAGVFRALGLVGEDFDLFESMNDLMGSGTLGYYTYEEERIALRGKELTPDVASTLVHELTHALQDQHFDLGGRTAELEEDTTGKSIVWDALIEGDASRIETIYRDELSEEDFAELEAAEAEAVPEDALEGIPGILVTFIGSSYSFGEVFLALATELEGDEVVDELFEDPPTSEEHLLDPWTWFADEDAAEEVPVPKLAKGEKGFDDDGTFGSPSWLFVLAERLDLETALAAADGWGGDQYVSFERDDRVCMRIDYVADSDDDLAEMRSALDAWVAAGPADTARVEDRGDGLRFESCDPGEGQGVEVKDLSGAALELAISRTGLGYQLAAEGAPDEVARCWADAMVRQYSLDELADESLLDTPAQMARFEATVADCPAG